MAIAFQFKSNCKEVNAKMSELVARQMPFAISKALNATAKTMVAKNKSDMSRIFDRPVSYTLNAFHYVPARKHSNKVEIRRKQTARQHSKHWLEVQNEGGPRPQTAFEKMIKARVGYAGFNHITPVPKNARMNANGNMTPGQYVEILSALQASRDTSQHAKRAGQTAKMAKRGRSYYATGRGSNMRPGIYETLASGKTRKVMNFIQSANYRPKLRFEERMQLYGSNNYEKNLRTSLRQAMATAKLR